MTLVSNYAGGVAVDARATRAKLMSAGERLFAEQGIHGAQIRDIVRAAGQANDSAVHYHFGSRDGLLAAICERHIEAMEPARRRRLNGRAGPVDLDAVVADLLAPTADRLAEQDGRYFLRITAQLAGQAGVRSGTLSSAVSGSALRVQLEELQRLCAQLMPVPLARERVAIMIGALTAALAERAVAIDAARRLVLGHRAFVANLEVMLVAALRAPVPAPLRN
jgi:AcrR family transcriptional regulator